MSEPCVGQGIPTELKALGTLPVKEPVLLETGQAQPDTEL